MPGNDDDDTTTPQRVAQPKKPLWRRIWDRFLSWFNK
jgi:hypothetical protein